MESWDGIKMERKEKEREKEEKCKGNNRWEIEER